MWPKRQHNKLKLDLNLAQKKRKTNENWPQGKKQKRKGESTRSTAKKWRHGFSGATFHLLCILIRVLPCSATASEWGKEEGLMG
jgi:hypothetical protein